MNKKMINHRNKETWEASYRQMEIAVGVLVHNIMEIRNVTEWALFMGYSRSHFCRYFKKKFRQNPKDVLRKARFNQICRTIQSDWSATAYKVALDSGFQNDKALHKFLQRNFNKGFLLLKDELKRKAFRERKTISFAAESDYDYFMGTQCLISEPVAQKGMASKSSSFPDGPGA